MPAYPNFPFSISTKRYEDMCAAAAVYALCSFAGDASMPGGGELNALDTMYQGNRYRFPIFQYDTYVN